MFRGYSWIHTTQDSHLSVNMVRGPYEMPETSLGSAPVLLPDVLSLNPNMYLLTTMLHPILTTIVDTKDLKCGLCLVGI